MALADDLHGIVAGEVDSSEASLEAVARDASLFYVKPQVVVRPKDAHDVCKVVQYVSGPANTADAQLSVTARSAGTDMGGGPLNTSIILDMTAHFTHIGEIAEAGTVVEPGVYFRDFDKETKKKGMELPSYTASRELNTIGGMIANNSGGEKNLKYGKTARYVESLDVVLSDGQVHTLKNLDGRRLAGQIGGTGL